MFASSQCTVFTPLKQGRTGLVTADRHVPKGPEKLKEHTGLFYHVLIIAFKSH